MSRDKASLITVEKHRTFTTSFTDFGCSAFREFSDGQMALLVVLGLLI